MSIRQQKNSIKPSFDFDHVQILKAAEDVSRFNKPKDKAEAIMRVLG